MDPIQLIRNQFNTSLQAAKNSADLESIKVHFLGKKGPIQALMKELKTIASDERPAFGQRVNGLRDEVAVAITEKEKAFYYEEEKKKLAKEVIDVTLPGRRGFVGRRHILTKTLDQMIEILSGMGFSVRLGPDIDTDYYNFEALNFASDHPARDMQDTFYISQDVLLRTHTSNVQVRVMETESLPIRIIAPGKAFRNEAISVRSHVMFHQLEAFYVDEQVSLGDLLATLKEFLEKLFFPGVEVRFRPSYFPFVEPGLEVDVRCLSCVGSGCPLCKLTGWLEVLGAGMIHPEVLKSGGIDPEVYTGYAWGMGVERIAMLKAKISDIRLFTENRLDFLSQFSAN